MCKDPEDNFTGVREIGESEMHSEDPEKEVIEEFEETHPANFSSDNDETADDQSIRLFLDISCCVDDYVDEEGEILAEEQSEPYPHIQDGEEHGSDQARSEKPEHLLMKLLGMMKLTGILRDDFLQYVGCPKCMTVYMLTETYELRRDGTKVCRTCGHIPFYNHPQQRSALRKKCGSALLSKTTYLSSEEYVHPIRSY